MKIRFSAPSKTFLFGEYAILRGGPSLIVSTGPRFEMRIESRGEGVAGGVHPNSPAGMWMRSHREDFNSVNLQFMDPHQGRGGFGASSAQFLFVNLWSRIQRQSLSALLSQLKIQDVWKDFQSLHQDKSEDRRPSGGDVVSQWQGGLCQFSSQPFTVSSLSWPFADLEFGLLRTNSKLATHTHLESLGHTHFENLQSLSARGIEALRSQDRLGFLKQIEAFSEELARLGLVTLPTQEILSRLKGHSAILTAKGCGAMGADVVAFFYHPKDRSEIQSFLSSQGWEWTSGSSELAEGLQISVDLAKESESDIARPGEWL